MVQRQQRTTGELEALCLLALQGQLGLNRLDYVKIGNYSGPDDWTWEIIEAGPDVPEPELNKAVDAVRIFQENFDLKKR
jgi:hypothetical protein